MKAVIMAGGLGTRLRPLTFSIPKPLLPIREKPILEIIIRKLHTFGIREIILAVGYGAELIKTYFQDGTKFDVKIDYISESKQLGTAGPLKLINDYFQSGELFLVMNGDILTKLNFREMIDFHLKYEGEMTIAIKKYEYQLPYGVVDTQNNLVKGVNEKPTFSFDISTGIYILNYSAIDYIPDNTYFTMPNLARILIENGKRVLSYHFDEYWLAIEQIDHFQEAEANLAEWVDY